MLRLPLLKTLTREVKVFVFWWTNSSGIQMSTTTMWASRGRCLSFGQLHEETHHMNLHKYAEMLMICAESNKSTEPFVVVCRMHVSPPSCSARPPLIRTHMQRCLWHLINKCGFRDIILFSLHDPSSNGGWPFFMKARGCFRFFLFARPKGQNAFYFQVIEHNTIIHKHNTTAQFYQIGLRELLWTSQLNSYKMGM